MGENSVLRKWYLEKLSAFRDYTGFTKIIIGMRRCGKSTLIEQYISLLTGSGVNSEQITFLNLESKTNRELLDENTLYDYLISKKNNDRSYILLDEAQNIPIWEKTIAPLMIDMDCDIYPTGSNAHFLSTDLSTHMTGRSISINILPLSFGESTELNGYREAKYRQHSTTICRADPCRRYAVT
jgi:predicted AAA+ superfamily ATPase